MPTCIHARNKELKRSSQSGILLISKTSAMSTSLYERHHPKAVGEGRMQTYIGLGYKFCLLQMSCCWRSLLARIYTSTFPTSRKKTSKDDDGIAWISSLLAHTIYETLAFDASMLEEGFMLEGTSAAKDGETKWRVWLMSFSAMQIGSRHGWLPKRMWVFDMGEFLFPLLIIHIVVEDQYNIIINDPAPGMYQKR